MNRSTSKRKNKFNNFKNSCCNPHTLMMKMKTHLLTCKMIVFDLVVVDYIKINMLTIIWSIFRFGLLHLQEEVIYHSLQLLEICAVLKFLVVCYLLGAPISQPYVDSVFSVVFHFIIFLHPGFELGHKSEHPIFLEKLVMLQSSS